jgi:CRISPR-associated protein Cas2
MKRRPAIIAYDIRNPLRRRRVHRLLSGWRLGGQKSVHECLLNEGEAQEVFTQISELIDPETDHLMLAWLSPHAEPTGLAEGESDSLFRRFLHVA